MELIEKRADLTVAHKIGYILFSITFLVLPFYYQDNLGGEGMSLPFNAVIWIGVTLLIAAGILQVVVSGHWVKPNYLPVLGAFPTGIIAVGFITGLDRPGEWIIRLAVIIGGFLFWFALLQYRFKRRDMENHLYILLASILLHAMVGLVQLAPDTILRGWIPIGSDRNFIGMFQQPNLQASMMATGVALALYLGSLPSYSGQRWPMKTLIGLILVLATFELVGSASRIGLLTVIPPKNDWGFK